MSEVGATAVDEAGLGSSGVARTVRVRHASAGHETELGSSFLRLEVGCGEDRKEDLIDLVLGGASRDAPAVDVCGSGEDASAGAECGSELHLADNGRSFRIVHRSSTRCPGVTQDRFAGLERSLHIVGAVGTSSATTTVVVHLLQQVRCLDALGAVEVRLPGCIVDRRNAERTEHRVELDLPSPTGRQHVQEADVVASILDRSTGLERLSEGRRNLEAEIVHLGLVVEDVHRVRHHRHRVDLAVDRSEVVERLVDLVETEGARVLLDQVVQRHQVALVRQLDDEAVRALVHLELGRAGRCVERHLLASSGAVEELVVEGVVAVFAVLELIGVLRDDRELPADDVDFDLVVGVRDAALVADDGGLVDLDRFRCRLRFVVFHSVFVVVHGVVAAAVIRRRIVGCRRRIVGDIVTAVATATGGRDHGQRKENGEQTPPPMRGRKHGFPPGCRSRWRSVRASR